MPERLGGVGRLRRVLSRVAFERGGGIMLIITVRVDRPAGQAIGIKEQIAMDLERYGDTHVLKVEEVTPEQLTLEEGKK